VKEFIKKAWWIYALGFSLWFTIYYFTNKAKEADYNNFYNSPIAGRLTSCNLTSKGNWAVFQLESGREYVFIPIRSDGRVSDASKFQAMAERKDSIYKKSMTDTLYLIKKGGRTIKFLFKKSY